MSNRNNKILILTLIFISTLSYSAYEINANGGASFPGYTGTDITLAESKPFEEFIVDEEVVIDINTSYISVVYDINNTSPVVKSFNMLFPIESKGCGLKEYVLYGDKSWEELTDFKAKLNDMILPIKFLELSEVKLEGEYNNFDGRLCSLISFPVEIKPGQNKLMIGCHVEPAHWDAGGSGGFWYLAYPIWPAKNWVTKFRKALWRVVIPRYEILSERTGLGSDYYKFQFDDWYLHMEEYSSKENGKEVNFMEWRKKGWSVTGPGIRKDYKDYVNFVAIDYIPAGEVLVEFAMDDLHHMVMNDCTESWNQEVDDKLCIESFLKIHPYVGDKRCYFAADFESMPGEMDFRFGPEAMPFFRNEIYARKGYIFTSEPMKKFFSKIPWYQPKFKNVKLTEVEMWNVEYIKEIEKKVHTIQDYNNNPYILNEIRRQMKKIP